MGVNLTKDALLFQVAELKNLDLKGLQATCADFEKKYNERFKLDVKPLSNDVYKEHVKHGKVFLPCTNSDGDVTVSFACMRRTIICICETMFASKIQDETRHNPAVEWCNEALAPILNQADEQQHRDALSITAPNSPTPKRAHYQQTADGKDTVPEVFIFSNYIHVGACAQKYSFE